MWTPPVDQRENARKETRTIYLLEFCPKRQTEPVLNHSDYSAPR